MLKIRELREEMQLTQKQLAEKISNMQRNISNWEKGVSEPDLQTVVALADLFDVSLDELFGRERSYLLPQTQGDSQLLQSIAHLSPQQKSALNELLHSFGVR